MGAQYRMIHFEPDPFLEARFPLGAVVAEGGRVLGVARALRIPSAAYLGSQGVALAARRLQMRLEEVTSFKELPAVFGPYVTLGPVRQIPPGVEDPLRWVERLFAGPG